MLKFLMAFIKIDKNNLLNNLEIISKRAGSIQKIAAVLKDNAYGHGLVLTASILKDFGIKRAVVRNVDEAVKIKDFFDYILILTGTAKNDGFFYTINCLEDLKKAQSGSYVEIKVDTGMHRNGILFSELESSFLIAKEKSLDIKGVFTHFRSADELSSELFWQDKIWQDVKEKAKELSKIYGFDPHFHSANSATLFRLGCKDDFARVGIAMYGYLEMDEAFDYPKLKPILSLWAKKISQRLLKKGERIGYGGTFEAKEDMTVSNYDVGYADGIFRSLKFTKDGDILGRVSMDNISVASTKDEICIFDDAKRIAKSLDTISYEVLVKLSPFIKRVIV